MPVFTLYLSTQITAPASNLIVPIDKTNLANVLYRVDFTNLFGNYLDEYKYCRVRYHLVGESFTASSPAGLDWTNYSGTLSLSLPSTFNGTTWTNGALLGIIYPVDCPISGTGIHCMLGSTLSECGVDINPQNLKAVTDLRITLSNWVTSQPLATMQNYMLLLSFELYN